MKRRNMGFVLTLMFAGASMTGCGGTQLVTREGKLSNGATVVGLAFEYNNLGGRNGLLMDTMIMPAGQRVVRQAPQPTAAAIAPRRSVTVRQLCPQQRAALAARQRAAQARQQVVVVQPRPMYRLNSLADAGPGWLNATLVGAIPAAINAGGFVGGMAALRPPRYNSTTTASTGEATASAGGGSASGGTGYGGSGYGGAGGTATSRSLSRSLSRANARANAGANAASSAAANVGP